MAAAGPSRRLFEVFVARVPWTAGANEVKQYFAQFGSVRKCMLPFDKETGFHKGFCWIGFSTEEGVKNSLQKDTHILEGAKDCYKDKGEENYAPHLQVLTGKKRNK